MYSLGIILFEMSYPLKTAMERAEIVGKIREACHSLPLAFEEPEKSVQGDIISSLVKHKVSERPSSLELLRSGKIPLQVEDEIVRTAIQGISDTTSPYYTKLLDALFTRRQVEEIAANDYTYDMPVTSNVSSNDLLMHKLIKDKLSEIFRSHGAVETRRPLLLPDSHYYSNAAARLLDASGTLVQLPYDLTLPNARNLAKSASPIRKTYTFGDVYRAALPGAHPKSHGEVDFDIVSYNSLDLALREAEVLKVIDEVIDIFPSLDSTKMCYHIGHSRLLDRIFSSCGIAEQKWDAVKEIISKLNIGSWTWAKIRNELRAPGVAVASTSLDDLMRYDFRDTYDKAIPKIRGLLLNTEDLESTFRHLEAVITYLGRFKVKRKIYINPLSSFNDKFYHGNILFQCIFNTKNRSVLAAGGRYDQLIQKHRPNTKIGDRHAVGFNLGWERLVTSMIRYQSEVNKTVSKKGDEELNSLWTPKRCEVLIESVDSASLRTTGIQILQELWANQISAELSIDVEASQEDAGSQSKDSSGTHSWTVLIKQEGMLKVKSLIRKDEVELRAAELVAWLRGEMRDRDRSDGRTIDRPKAQRHLIHQGSAGFSSEREPDVRVLMSQTRSKKSNRKNIVEDGKQIPLAKILTLANRS